MNQQAVFEIGLDLRPLLPYVNSFYAPP